MKEEAPLKMYFKLIRASLSENRNKNEGVYYEEHHIVPRCFKKRSGTCLLTAREHWLAHQLLCQHYKDHIHYGEKLKWAFHMMTYSRGKYLSASEYQEAREMLMPLWQRERNPEYKRAISESHKGKKYFKSPKTGEVIIVPEEQAQPFIDAGWENTHWSKGRTFSNHTLDKMSASATRTKTGLRGLKARASKGPYSVKYEDGRVITADSMMLLSEESGIKHQILYWRFKNRKGLIINGFGVFKGDLTAS